MGDVIEYQLVTENVATTLEPNLRVVEYISPSWNFIVVFAAIILMLFNKQLFTQRFRMMLSVLSMSSDCDRMTREWNPIVSVNGLTVFVSYVALLALVVQKIILVFSRNIILYSGFGFYMDVCVFIMAFMIIQYLIVTLYGWLFGIEAATTHHEVAHLSTMTVLNIVMSFFGLIIIFYPIKIILIVTSVIILIIMGIRIIKTFFEFQILSKMNLLNIFLYFCTLEIIPLSVAITMICRLVVTDCVL
ncbi:MAG: DUF4271 domain-containing protein [Bacteroidales bacterium]|nr:DUF4271 domain-containing protein [Bacteroidales bacterium]MBO7529968.1 DUF4271 domain-containing protein [Bacteroidales bacterium]MBQ3844213.1 DUF4271 domain-containing protein [Bacteroidales bacterium]